MQISIDDRKFVLLAIIVAGIFIRQPLIAALIPFLLALALAAILEPVARKLERSLKFPRVLASSFVLSAFVVAGGYLFLLVSAKILSELVRMGGRLQRYQDVPVDLVTQLLIRWNELNELIDQRGIPGEVRDNIINAVENLTNTAFSLIGTSINVVIGAVGQIPALLVVVVIALIATYFLVKDKDALVQSALSIAPEAIRAKAREIGRRVIVDLVGFVRGQLLLFLITTVIVSVGLILIGVDYWLTLALISGILDVIPVVGPGFLFFPWAIFAWALGHPVLSLQLFVLYVFTFLVRQVIQPKVLGDSIGVHPIAMLVALYAGIQFFGLQGLIVAPILVIIAKGVIQFARSS